MELRPKALSSSSQVNRRDDAFNIMAQMCEDADDFVARKHRNVAKHYPNPQLSPD